MHAFIVGKQQFGERGLLDGASTSANPSATECLDGQRACPPEDCGGIYGYYDLLEAISDRKHPNYKQSREWLGSFNPEQFNLKL